MFLSHETPDFAYAAVSALDGATVAETTAPGVLVGAPPPPSGGASLFRERDVPARAQTRGVREFYGPVLEQDVLKGYVRVAEYGIGTRANGAAAVQADVARAIREIVYPECVLLAEELARTQVYVASRTRGSTVSCVYLNGSLARYPNIQQRIGELVALPVRVLNPLEVFGAVADPRLELQPSIALATGLALRGGDDA